MLNRDLVNPGSGIGIRFVVILPRKRISVTLQMEPAYYLRLFFILLANSINSCLPVTADRFLLFPMLFFLDWNAVGGDFLAGNRIFA
jgi:hypothetical protein